MEKTLEHNMDIEIIFHFKMCYFEYVSEAVQLACLEQYLDYLQTNSKYINDQIQLFLEKKDRIRGQKQFQVMQMLDHRKHVCLTDMDWVTKERERIQKST